MAWNRCLCLAWCIALGHESACRGGDPAGDPIHAELEVQVTMQQARDLLNQGRPADAVTLLESKLALIRGRIDYLATLREAYLAWIRDLKLKNQDEQVENVQRKLRLLEPIVGTRSPEVPSGPESTKLKETADPFQQKPLADPSDEASDLLRRAVAAFDQRRFHEAATLFSQVNERQPELLRRRKSDWAYCRMAVVVDRLKSGSTLDATQRAALDAELQQAIELAENNSELAEFGKRIQQRLRGNRLAEVSEGAVPPGWSSARSPHFRLIHTMSPADAEKLLKLLEKHRAIATDRWAGGKLADWTSPCDVYVHPTGVDYQRATGKDPRGWGHATIEIIDRRVVRRRLDFPGDEADFPTAGIPREVTHLVLVDLFPDPMLPRWADEALAILSMPRNYVDRYLQVLPRLFRDRQLMPWEQLLTSPDFPSAEHLTAFYVQSVSLCDLLIADKGTRQFVAFLQQSQRVGLETALRQSYGFRNLAVLHEHWQKHAFDSLSQR